MPLDILFPLAGQLFLVNYFWCNLGILEPMNRGLRISTQMCNIDTYLAISSAVASYQRIILFYQNDVLGFFKIVIYISKYIKKFFSILKAFKVGLYKVFTFMVSSLVYCELLKAETLFFSLWTPSILAWHIHIMDSINVCWMNHEGQE